MNSVLCDGTQPSGGCRRDRRLGSTVQCEDRPGCPACEPGTLPRRRLPGWSTSDRRSGSRSGGAACRTRCPSSARTTSSGPAAPGPKNPGGSSSAALKTGCVRRGNGWSAAANFSRVLEQVVARSIDRAQTVGGQAVRDLVRIRAHQRLAVVRVAGRVGIDGSARIRIALERARVALGDLDLLEDEGQVGGRDGEARCRPARLLPWPGRSCPARAGWRPRGRRRPRERRKPPAASAAGGASARQAWCLGRDDCAALEARSVHNDPPQKSYEWAAGSPSREPTCATIRARTLRNLLFPGSKRFGRHLHPSYGWGAEMSRSPAGRTATRGARSATTGQARTLRARPARCGSDPG